MNPIITVEEAKAIKDNWTRILGLVDTLLEYRDQTMELELKLEKLKTVAKNTNNPWENTYTPDTLLDLAAHEDRLCTETNNIQDIIQVCVTQSDKTLIELAEILRPGFWLNHPEKGFDFMLAVGFSEFRFHTRLGTDGNKSTGDNLITVG